MPALQEILKTLEELRKKLNKLAETRALTDPEVLSLSRMLDAVFNEYLRLMKDKK